MIRKRQKSRLSTWQVLCLVGILAFLLLNLSCGASRQNTDTGEESHDIDDLLGDDEIASSNRESDEAEVLRLLGITSTDESPAPIKTTAVTQPSSTNNIESELDKLRDDVLEKDQEISDLRAKLTKKEIQISDLEAQNITRPQPKYIPVSGKSGEPSQEFKLRYQDALSLFKERKYQTALSTLNDLIQSDDANSLSDNCQYWIGECYYGMANYNQAISEFEKVFRYSNSNKSDDAQLKLGLCYMRLGDNGQARAEFDRLLTDYPDSEYRAAAKKYISRL